MKNDAKLGMLAGVLGVIVAAVLFANAPPPDAQSHVSSTADLKPKETHASTAAAVPLPAPTPPEVNTTELPSTPVARTRKEPNAQPASRSGLAGEEP